MSQVRVVMKEFVSGDLDFAGLQKNLSGEVAAGATREEALHALEALTRREKLSPAVVGLLRRSIDRHFSTDDTDPFPSIRPSEERRDEKDHPADDTVDGEFPAMYAAESTEDGPVTEEGPATEDGPVIEEAPTTAEGPVTAQRPPAEEPPPEESGPPSNDGPPAGQTGPRSRSRNGESAGDGSPVQEPASAGAAGAQPTVREKDPEPGDVVGGRYALERLVGRGGIGLVYRAVDRCREEAGLEEPRVAVKLLKADQAGRDEARRRLLAEGFRASDLQHENLVRVFDVGDDGRDCFVVMELLEGASLRSAILRASPEGLPRDEALPVLRGILQGVAFLHARGRVHGDLKPGNVFLTRDGVPKLLDFGTSVGHGREREPTLDGTSLPGRTPAYASPEVLGGSWPLPSDDVFSLACLACEMLTSKHPFDRVQADEAREQGLRPSLPKSISSGRRRVLARALRFDGRRRPKDAAEFLDGMELAGRDRGTAVLGAGLLAGLALGVLLVLAIIDPAGPLARLLSLTNTEPAVSPPVVTDEVAEGSGSPGRDTVEIPPPSVDVAGRFVPTEPAPVEEAAGGGESAVPGESESPLPTAPVPDSASTEASGTPAVATSTGPGRLSFATASLRVTEGTAVLIATVTRQGGTTGDVSFRWRTTGGSATPDADYVASGWQETTIPDGQDSVRIYVPLVDDGIAEDTETFSLELSRPGGGASLDSPDRLRVTIVDDES